MSPKQTGYIVFLAALGVMATLIGNEVATFHTWGEAVTPAFIGQALMNIGSVIASFVGGRLIPTEADQPQVHAGVKP